MVFLLAAVFAVGAHAQEGHKQTERLVKRAGETLKQIVETKQQLQKTLTIYNSIIDAKTDDANKTYKDLVKAVEQCEKKRGDVQNKTEEMEKEAHIFFQEWNASLSGISNEDLKKRSQERLNDTRVRYGDILSAGRRAGAEFDTFIGDLRDQIAYLGFDLNPSAVESLKGDAAKLNQHGDVLFGKIDDVNKKITEYIQSIQPTSSN
jgi:chromosome segregation ATPase